MRADAARAAIEALPLVTFEAAFGSTPFLVLAPHPDDESLACGGLIAEACTRASPPVVAILTDGSRSHPNSRAWSPTRLAALRAEEARAAAAALGLPPERLLFLRLRDGRAPHRGFGFVRALRRLCALAEAHDIRTICTSWIGDPHGDHGAAAKLAAAAAARLGLRHLAFPVWALVVHDCQMLPSVESGFRLPIERHLPAKRRAIAAHASQHGRVVQDDPGGFVLPPDFLALFDRPWEAFLDQR